MTYADFAVTEPFDDWAWPLAWNWAEARRNQIADDFFPSTLDGFVESSIRRYYRTFGLWTNGRLSGAIAVERASPIVFTAHILLSKRLWGIPASELRTVAALLFASEPQLIRIQAYVPVWNRLALALTKRLGGTVEGTLHSATMRNGKPADAVLLAITREDFFNGIELRRRVQEFGREQQVEQHRREHILGGPDSRTEPDGLEPVERSGSGRDGQVDAGNSGTGNGGRRSGKQDVGRSDGPRKQLPRGKGPGEKRTDRKGNAAGRTGKRKPDRK
jgi:RimJ/RimL family protein N-acetyltransferase